MGKRGGKEKEKQKTAATTATTLERITAAAENRPEGFEDETH